MDFRCFSCILFDFPNEFQQAFAEVTDVAFVENGIPAGVNAVHVIAENAIALQCGDGDIPLEAQLVRGVVYPLGFRDQNVFRLCGLEAGIHGIGIFIPGCL